MSIKKIFSGKLLNLYLDTSRKLPNKNRTRLEYIKHPGAAIVVPFLDTGNLVFVRQYRPVIDKYILELPAGTLAKGEAPLHCAKRELEEETGYRAGSVKTLGHIYTTPGFTTEKIHIFEARNLKAVVHAREPDEVLETVILNRKKIRRLLREGKISDAKTIAALACCGVL